MKCRSAAPPDPDLDRKPRNMKKQPDSTMRPAEYPFARPEKEWTDRVSYAGNGAYAFRPRQILVTGAETAAEALAETKKRSGGAVQKFTVFADHELLVAVKEFDVERLVGDLRARGFRVEPNYVLFSHSAGHSGAGCGCQPCSCGTNLSANPFMANPFMANPFMANPFMANPFMANPFMANPFMANPFMANPFMANPFMANYAATGMQPSSARPAVNPNLGKPSLTPGSGRAIILDTGIAMRSKLPTMLKTDRHMDAQPGERDRPDENNDSLLDPVAGHGTFIAGIIEQLAPKHDVQVFSVLSTFGDGDAASIASRINDLRTAGELDPQTILNMSFGSYADVQMHVLAEAVKLAQDQGAVIVASAGNDGTSVPSFPACLPDVVGVGSIDECGRAPYSNFGSWVRACAPGSELVSSFYSQFDGSLAAQRGQEDPDRFASWAQWTGTSFAAPVVVAALMRHMALTNVNANQAVEMLIDGANLGRIPGLGAVINLVPGM